ncbi:MAG: site-specific integrase [Oscillospiraceae bacterium]|nr:site-specific integrase [Oscillospiraceae bacterium]
MAERRKDNKGRVLRKGESQRKDLLYQYRYTDVTGQRKTVYAKALPDLREKERQIEEAKNAGVDYQSGKITVLELLEIFISVKKNVKPQTIRLYNERITVIGRTWLGPKRICEVKQTDAKQWFVERSNEGKSYNTLRGFSALLKVAFQMAYDEYAIKRNPFSFNLRDVLRNDTKKKEALTPEQQRIWLEFIRSKKCYRRHYHQYVILLETGMRISEFCGLTIKDLDFEARTIRIERQLAKMQKHGLIIQEPKSSSGIRTIPMTDTAYESFKALLAERPKLAEEPVVDGVSGFVLLNIKGCPTTGNAFDGIVRDARRNFQKMHPDIEMPDITPHTFRHTFCTNMANAGMDPKTLQYIMGHATVNMTLNHYAHTGSEQAIEQMEKLNLRSVEKANISE